MYAQCGKSEQLPLTSPVVYTVISAAINWKHNTIKHNTVCHGWTLAHFDFCTYMLYILYILYISYLLYLYCIVIVISYLFHVSISFTNFFQQNKKLKISWLKGRETLVVYLRPKQIANDNVWPNSNFMLIYVLFCWNISIYIYHSPWVWHGPYLTGVANKESLIFLVL